MWGRKKLEVVPVINCEDYECVKKKLDKAESFLKDNSWLHIDVADGLFTFNKTWGSPRDWATLRLPYKIEVHLMVEEPERCVSDWLAAGAKRLIVHVETIKNDSLDKILSLSSKYKANVMLSFNPETPVRKIEPYFQKLNAFQVLAVSPGAGGQKFLPTVLDKIDFLRRHLPNVKIEVDGGMSLAVAKLAKAAGADSVTSGAYIFTSPNPKEAYEKLQKV